MENSDRLIKRLNTTLPDRLAKFVGEISGKNGIYETPSEFIRDLIRRYMASLKSAEDAEIMAMYRKTFQEDDFSPLLEDDIEKIRRLINE